MGDMNAPLRTRIRDGCRGGREQFTWNSIKEQDYKDREQYLGATMKVGMMGKFGRYQLHDWYARKRDAPESIKDERASVQAYEEELMQEALGLKPKKLMLSKKPLSEEELKEVLKRDDAKSEDKKGRSQMGPQAKIVTNEFGEQVATSNEEFVAIAAREAPVKGLGFAMHRNAKLEAIKAETLGTESQLEGTKSASSSVKVETKEEVKGEHSDDDSSAEPGVVDARVKNERGDRVEVKKEPAGDAAHGSKRRRLSGEGKLDEAGEDGREKKEKKGDKKRRKAEKKLKKIEKKLKKVAKKEKKAAKKAARQEALERQAQAAASAAKKAKSSSSSSSSSS